MNLHFANDPNTVQTLRDYIDRKMIAFDSPRYAYVVINKKNLSDIFGVSNYPDEWIEFYRSENLQYVDPVALTAFKRISPFSWDENITVISDLKLTKIFSLSKQYNVANGFTFVLHDHLNNLATLSIIVSHEAEEKMEDNIARNRAALQMLLISTHEKMLMLNEQASSSCKKENEPAKIIFTPRENEVLYWASMGKTYPEIGIIAGIAPRTVKFHMGNVIRKLGVLNSRQAIRLGVELGLIDLAPSRDRRCQWPTR